MKTSLRADWPQWALIAGMFAASAVAWPTAPEQIPVHWNLQGQVDRYGGKWEGLLLIPALSLGVYLLLLVLPRIDPGRANYDRFRAPYSTIRFAILAFLALVHTTVLLIAFGYPLDVNRIIWLALGVLFLVFGNFMGKIRPNWFIGIRTPWTLSSKLSWTRTHRLGGWLLIALGLLAIATTVLPPPWNLAVFLGATLFGTLGLTVYSYLVWRRDPDRIPPSGTTPAEE